MSDLLDRIVKEIRERLAASRAAVLEHERLEAALHALEDTASRATRAVSGRGPGQPAGTTRPSAKRSPATGKRASAATDGSGKRRPSTPAPNASEAKGGGRSARRDGRATPAAKRSPRGANRQAVLRVVGERPGVSTHELAAVSGVTGGTLYALLRTLTQRGELEKRPLPGGQTGYVLGTSPGTRTSEAAPAETPAPTASAPDG